MFGSQIKSLGLQILENYEKKKEEDIDIYIDRYESWLTSSCCQLCTEYIRISCVLSTCVYWKTQW